MTYVISNSTFFTVPAAPLLENVGWEVKVRSHTDMTTLLAIVPEWISLSIGPQLNDPGAGSITLNLDTPFWRTTLPNGNLAPTLLDNENLWEAYEDGQLRFQWLARNTEETILDDSETHAVTVSGPGGADTLRWGVILRPAFPAAIPPGLDPVTSVVGTNHTVALGWEFPTTWPAMLMWWVMLDAVRSRHGIPWLVPLFSDTLDSGGEPWEYVPTVGSVSGEGFRPTIGENLLDFLNDCTGQDYGQWFAMRAEWFMWPGMRLDVRKKIGSHREDQVIFFEGNLTQKTRARSRENIANMICVIDVNGYEAVAVDYDSIAKWGRREQLQDKNKNVTESSRQAALARAYLEESHDESAEWVVQIPYGLPGRRPFIDFNIGDWIGVSRLTDFYLTSLVDAFRVLAIVVKVENDTVTVELTLNSVQEDRLKQLEQLVTWIVNNGPQSTTDIPINDTAGNVDTSLKDITGGDNTSLNADGSFTCRVWIQNPDPGSKASIGDFWYQTDFDVQTEIPYVPDDPDTTTTTTEDDKRERKIPLPDRTHVTSPTVTYNTSPSVTYRVGKTGVKFN